jgi:hypothetical protein
VGVKLFHPGPRGPADHGRAALREEMLKCNSPRRLCERAKHRAYRCKSLPPPYPRYCGSKEFGGLLPPTGCQVWQLTARNSELATVINGRLRTRGDKRQCFMDYPIGELTCLRLFKRYH